MEVICCYIMEIVEFLDYNTYMHNFYKLLILIQFSFTWNMAHGQPINYFQLKNFHLVNISQDTTSEFSDYSTYVFIFNNHFDSMKINVRLPKKSYPVPRLNDCKLDTGINYTISFRGCSVNDSLKKNAVNYSFYNKYCTFINSSNNFQFKSITTKKRISSFKINRNTNMKTQIIYEYKNCIFLLDYVLPCIYDQIN